MKEKQQPHYEKTCGERTIIVIGERMCDAMMMMKSYVELEL